MKVAHKAIIQAAKDEKFEEMFNIYESFTKDYSQELPAWFSGCPISLLASNINLPPTFDTDSILSNRVLDLCKTAVASISVIDSETLSSALVKIFVIGDDFDLAVTYKNACRSRKLRTYQPLLWSCAKRRDTKTADSLIDEMMSLSISFTQADLGLLLLAGVDVEKCLNLFGDRFDRVESEELYQALLSRECETWKFLAKCAEIPTGICPITGLVLQRVGLKDKELEELLSLAKRLAFEAPGSETSEWADFEKDLLKRLETRVLLDGANIGHTNQNFEGGFFRHCMVEEVRKKFPGSLVFLHSKWLDSKTNLKMNLQEKGVKRPKRKLPQLLDEPHIRKEVVRPSEPDPIEVEKVSLERIAEVLKWKSLDCLIEVPRGANDDWYWFYAVLFFEKNRRLLNPQDDPPFLISNDLMRDHLWRMGSVKEETWKRFTQSHICHFQILYPSEDPENREYRFSVPPSWSPITQKQITTNGHIWHIPIELISPASDDGVSNRFLVLLQS